MRGEKEKAHNMGFYHRRRDSNPHLWFWRPGPCQLDDVDNLYKLYKKSMF